MKMCNAKLPSSCNFNKDYKCTKVENCGYQIDDGRVELPEENENGYELSFCCEKCNKEWIQTTMSPCSQILGICGSCGHEKSYIVIPKQEEE